jgi:hypothetical protein
MSLLNDLLGTIGGGLMTEGGKAVKGSPTQSAGSAGLGVLIDVAINFGVSYLTAKGEKRKNEQLLKRMAELDDKQAEKLKKLIAESATEMAKTKVIFDFLAEEDAKKLEAQRKRERILPIIGLGFGVVLLGLIFYKLHKQNKNG